MAVARYLHFAFQIGTGGSYTSVASVEVYDAASVDVTAVAGTAGAVSASSEYNGSYVKANAFDYNTSTAWGTSGGDPGWLRYDLGVNVDVRSIIFRNWRNNGEPPQSVTVYGSTSGLPPGPTPYGMDKLITSALDTVADPSHSTTVAVGATAVQPFTPPTTSGHARVIELHVPLPPWSDFVHRVKGPAIGNDFLPTFGGHGYLSGHTYITGTPNTPDGFVRVGLFRERGGFVRSMTSDASGFYRFDGLDPKQRYFVVSFDDTHDYNAVIKDNLTPMV